MRRLFTFRLFLAFVVICLLSFVFYSHNSFQFGISANAQQYDKYDIEAIIKRPERCGMEISTHFDCMPDEGCAALLPDLTKTIQTIHYQCVRLLTGLYPLMNSSTTVTNNQPNENEIPIILCRLSRFRNTCWQIVIGDGNGKLSNPKILCCGAPNQITNDIIKHRAVRTYARFREGRFKGYRRPKV
ncbi:hypothetical protein M3Y94_00468800 [Aphelenchoides besseyi]|nr:hypothetical protein M3Y94_00468800 [Aphelenchoides besseyi]KAI6219994.1 hypothetical protein M3Y95_01086400 [Aphelenchoides besseyi]